MAYVTPEELHARCPDFDLDDDADVAVVELLLGQASDYIDDALRHSGDPAGPLFVVPGESAEPSDRIFVGTGTPYLRIDPHTGVLTEDDVTLPDGFDAPTWVESGGVLVGTLDDRRGRDIWPVDIPVTVSAVWGAVAVPGDVKNACLALATTWYVASHSTSDQTAIRSEIPAAVTEMIDCRRAERALAVMW